MKCRGVAQSGSASGLGPEGRKFESCLPDHSSLRFAELRMAGHPYLYRCLRCLCFQKRVIGISPGPAAIERIGMRVI